MLKNKQTIFDFESGNCWATAISCVLELPLEEVPNFCAKGTDVIEDGVRLDWYRRTVLWLRERGWDMVTFRWPVPAEAELIPPDGICLVTGPSPRNNEKLHVVVGRIVTRYVQSGDGWGTTFDLVSEHDPHPDDTLIAGDPKEVSILVRTAQ